MRTGCAFKPLMSELFHTTKLTPQYVAKKSGFLDWNTQPSCFKRYPHFCFRYDRKALGEYAWLLDLRRVTDVQNIGGGRVYERLNVPSAGNLHPLELYVQIRKIPGIISGIYHIDVKHDVLVLIREIERDGLELHVGLTFRFMGIILLMSLVPFRSFWKYGARAWRYCYLDAGHQIGAIVMRQEQPTFFSDYDAKALNDVMGFGDTEYVCSVMAWGEAGERQAEPLIPLMRVMPTDYSENFDEIKRALLTQLNIKDALNTMPMWPTIGSMELLQSRRRSAREFAPIALENGDVERFMDLFKHAGSLHVSTVVLRAHGYESGIYGPSGYVRRFDPDELVALLLSQRFIGTSGMVVCFHTVMPDANAHAMAGMIAQACYLLAESMHLGCSGIGAYYDDMLRSFLQTDEEIVYVLALGAKV